MAVDALISRLAKVRSTGKDTWLACCPAHEDKTPSLTVRALPDGRILVHCFAGCGAADVLGAVGLEFGELFPEGSRGEHKPMQQPFGPLDVLRALRREAAVIAISASDLAEGKTIDQQRVALAAERIADAAEYIHAA